MLRSYYTSKYLAPKEEIVTFVNKAAASTQIIDVHTHAEDIFGNPGAENFVRMGVTSVVTGNCDGSATEIGEFFGQIDTKPIAVNLATLIAHGSVRGKVMGLDDRAPTAEEQAKKNAEDKYTDHKVKVEGQDQKSVAGRVKMDGDRVPGVAQQGGKPRDQAAMMEHETLEDHEVEMELNAILKKSPSTLRLAHLSLAQSLTHRSDHLFEVLLPLLEESETHPAREVQHQARTLRRRTR